MSQETFNFWSIIFQIVIALGASFFALWQTLINRRLKKLQDYVSISLVPAKDIQTNEFQLQIKNVGKANVYLHKYEIGSQTQNYENARLIASGDLSFYIVGVPMSNINQEMPVKLYLIDEFGNKYLSTGAAIIDAVPTLPTSSPSVLTDGSQPLQIPVRVGLRAWSYKTKKFNWKI